MELRQQANGRWVAVTFRSTTNRFRSTLTEDFLPVESTNINLIPKIRTYKSPESAGRALRKFKDKL